MAGRGRSRRSGLVKWVTSETVWSCRCVVGCSCLGVPVNTFVGAPLDKPSSCVPLVGGPIRHRGWVAYTHSGSVLCSGCSHHFRRTFFVSLQGCQETCGAIKTKRRIIVSSTGSAAMMKNKEEAREKSEFLCHSEHIMLLVLRICVRNFTYDLFFVFRARKKKFHFSKPFLMCVRILRSFMLLRVMSW